MDDLAVRQVFFQQYEIPQILPGLGQWLEKGRIEPESLELLVPGITLWRDRETARRLLRRLPPDLGVEIHSELAMMAFHLQLVEEIERIEEWLARDRDYTQYAALMSLYRIRRAPADFPRVLRWAENPIGRFSDGNGALIACDRERARRTFRTWSIGSSAGGGAGGGPDDGIRPADRHPDAAG